MKRRTILAALGSTVAALPTLLRAQQGAVPVVGLLSSGGRYQSFYKGLDEIGYVEEKSVKIEHRLANGDYSRLSEMARDLVARRVDLIAALGPSAARAAKEQTSTVPIVFVSGDPVAERLVPSLARPGGNLTGIGLITVELMPKRFELLSQLVPQARAFALIVDPSAANADATMRELRASTTGKGATLHVLKANGSDYDQIDDAFNKLGELNVGGLIVDTDPLLIRRLPYFVAQSARHAVPAIYVSSEFVWAGGLISYGPDLTVAMRQAGTYAGRVLKGERPGDLAVQQPTKFELVINLKTAKTLNLTVPPSTLGQADQVIE